MNPEHYNAVREAVIKANPESLGWPSMRCRCGHIPEKYGRPIRLADVLLAIKINTRTWEEWRVAAALLIIGGDKPPIWELDLPDDLSLQRPETIEFLYQLLKP